MEQDGSFKTNGETNGHVTNCHGNRERRGSLCRRKISKKQQHAIQRWLNTQSENIDEESPPHMGDRGDIYSRGNSFEDDLNLGDEAPVLPGCSGRDTMVQCSDTPNGEAKQRRRAYQMANFFSITSEESANSSIPSSNCTSVEQILQERKPNAEEILESLGFGAWADESWTSKIPLRFLTYPTRARGINVEKIIEDNDDLKDKVNREKTGFGTFLGSPSCSSSSTDPSLKHASDVPFRRISRTISQSDHVFRGLTEGGHFYNSILICDNTRALQRQGHYDETLGRLANERERNRPLVCVSTDLMPDMVCSDENENYREVAESSENEKLSEEYILDFERSSKEDQTLLKPHRLVGRTDSDSTLVPEKSFSFASDSFAVGESFEGISRRPSYKEGVLLDLHSMVLTEEGASVLNEGKVEAGLDLTVYCQCGDKVLTKNDGVCYNCSKSTAEGQCGSFHDEQSISEKSAGTFQIPPKTPKLNSRSKDFRRQKFSRLALEHVDSFELEEIHTADDNNCFEIPEDNPLTRTISLQSGSSGFAEFDQQEAMWLALHEPCHELIPEVETLEVDNLDKRIVFPWRHIPGSEVSHSCECEKTFRPHSTDCLQYKTSGFGLKPVKAVKLKSFRSASVDLGVLTPSMVDKMKSQNWEAPKQCRDWSTVLPGGRFETEASLDRSATVVSCHINYLKFANKVVSGVIRQAFDDIQLSLRQRYLAKTGETDKVSRNVEDFCDRLSQSITDSAVLCAAKTVQKYEVSQVTDTMLYFADNIAYNAIQGAYEVVQDIFTVPPVPRRKEDIGDTMETETDLLEHLLNFDGNTHGNHRNSEAALSDSDSFMDAGLSAMVSGKNDHRNQLPRSKDNCDIVDRHSFVMPSGIDIGCQTDFSYRQDVFNEISQATKDNQVGKRDMSSKGESAEVSVQCESSVFDAVSDELRERDDLRGGKSTVRQSQHRSELNYVLNSPHRSQTFLSEAHLQVSPRSASLHKDVLVKNQRQKNHSRSTGATTYSSILQVEFDSESHVTKPPVYMSAAAASMEGPLHFVAHEPPRESSTPLWSRDKQSLASELLAVTSDKEWMLANDPTLESKGETKLPVFTTRYGPPTVDFPISIPSFVNRSSVASESRNTYHSVSLPCSGPSVPCPDRVSHWVTASATDLTERDRAASTHSLPVESMSKGGQRPRSGSAASTRSASGLFNNHDREMLTLSSIVRSPYESLNSSVVGKESLDANSSSSVGRLQQLSRRLKMVEEAKLMRETLKKYKTDLCLLDLASSKQLVDESLYEEMEAILREIHSEIITLEGAVSHRLSGLVSGDYTEDDLCSLHQMQVLESMIDLMKEQLYHQHLLRRTPSASMATHSEVSWQRTDSPLAHSESSWQQERDSVMSELASMRQLVRDQEMSLRQVVNESYSEIKSALMKELDLKRIPSSKGHTS